jgi:hypothetical protein
VTNKRGVPQRRVVNSCKLPLTNAREKITMLWSGRCAKALLIVRSTHLHHQLVLR